MSVVETRSSKHIGIPQKGDEFGPRKMVPTATVFPVLGNEEQTVSLANHALLQSVTRSVSANIVDYVDIPAFVNRAKVEALNRSEPTRLTARYRPMTNDPISPFKDTSGECMTWGELSDRYKTSITNMARHFGLTAEEAKDVHQEVMIKLNQNRENFDQARNFNTWLLGIAQNYIIDLKRRQREETSIDLITVAPKGLLNVGQASVDPEGSALHGETNALVQAVVEKVLSKVEWQILKLYHEGLSHKEISDVVGLTVPSIKQKVFKSRKKIREYIQENGLTSQFM